MNEGHFSSIFYILVKVVSCLGGWCLLILSVNTEHIHLSYTVVFHNMLDIVNRSHFGFVWLDLWTLMKIQRMTLKICGVLCFQMKTAWGSVSSGWVLVLTQAWRNWASLLRLSLRVELRREMAGGCCFPAIFFRLKVGLETTNNMHVGSNMHMLCKN